MSLTAHSAVLGAGLVASAGLWMLGQSADVSLPASVKELGPMALSSAAGAYFLRWFIGTYIPEVQKQHKEQIENLATTHAKAVDQIATAHQSTITKIVSEFRLETADQREQHEKTIKLILDLHHTDQPADASRPANQR